MRLSGFRKFLEDMDQNPEKKRSDAMGDGGDEDPGKEDYFAALGDEFGIEFSDLQKAFENEPWVSSHFSVGKPDKEMLYKLSAWEIIPGSLSPNGADIRLRHEPGGRSYLKGNMLNKSKRGDTRRYHLNRQELQKFLTTGWTPAVQAAGGAADPNAAAGAPPAAPPM